MIRSTPFKKSKATWLWSIIFLLNPRFLFIKLDIPGSLFICLPIDALFLRIVSLGHVHVSKLGAMAKRKICKIDWIVWEMHAMSSFGLSLCECVHAYPLPIHCTTILRIFRRISTKKVFAFFFFRGSNSCFLPSSKSYFCFSPVPAWILNEDTLWGILESIFWFSI